MTILKQVFTFCNFPVVDAFLFKQALTSLQGMAEKGFGLLLNFQLVFDSQ